MHLNLILCHPLSTCGATISISVEVTLIQHSTQIISSSALNKPHGNDTGAIYTDKHLNPEVNIPANNNQGPWSNVSTLQHAKTIRVKTLIEGRRRWCLFTLALSGLEKKKTKVSKFLLLFY